MAVKHGFIAQYTKEVQWEDDTRQKLPPGVKIKVLSEDPEVGRVDCMIKFPPGYVEPRHSHESTHSIVVLENIMRVAGKDLRFGDYVFGGKEEHGPYEYPEGCTVFIVFLGASMVHRY